MMECYLKESDITEIIKRYLERIIEFDDLTIVSWDCGYVITFENTVADERVYFKEFFEESLFFDMIFAEYRLEGKHITSFEKHDFNGLITYFVRYEQEYKRQRRVS